MNAPVAVAVVGLGKIGLTLAAQYASRGLSVIGCDTNASLVESVNSGHCPIDGEDELGAGTAGLDPPRESLLPREGAGRRGSGPALPPPTMRDS